MESKARSFLFGTKILEMVGSRVLLEPILFL